MSEDHKQGVWLEVENVRFEHEVNKPGECKVRLKGDREEPKAGWWPVISGAVAGSSQTEGIEFQDYRAIRRELDRNQLVLARLGVPPSSAEEASNTKGLACYAVSFQARELGSH